MELKWNRLQEIKMTKVEQQRKYVYENFGEMTKGTNMSNSKKTKLLRKLWKEAKKKYK